jgi:uncharacterized protein with PIN domain
MTNRRCPDCNGTHTVLLHHDDDGEYEGMQFWDEEWRCLDCQATFWFSDWEE